MTSLASEAETGGDAAAAAARSGLQRNRPPCPSARMTPTRRPDHTAIGASTVPAPCAAAAVIVAAVGTTPGGADVATDVHANDGESRHAGDSPPGAPQAMLRRIAAVRSPPNTSVSASSRPLSAAASADAIGYRRYAPPVGRPRRSRPSRARARISRNAPPLCETRRFGEAEREERFWRSASRMGEYVRASSAGTAGSVATPGRRAWPTAPSRARAAICMKECLV
jgi:hypothetical protein